MTRELSDFMDARRVDLGLTWADVAEQAGISRDTLHRVRSGDENVRHLTKASIERVLYWDQGSIDEILAGGEPMAKALHGSPGNPDDRDPIDHFMAQWYRLPRHVRARLFVKLAAAVTEDQQRHDEERSSWYLPPTEGTPQ